MKPRRAILLTLVALCLGVLGDTLLRGTPWGVNAAIVGAALAVAALFAMRRASPPVFAILGLGIVSLSMLVWRDTEFIQVWCVAGFLAALVLLSAHATGVSLRFMRIRDGISATVESGLRAVTQAVVLVTRDLPWERLTQDGRFKSAPAIVAGVVLTIPVLIVFGSLLRSAEPQFAALTDLLLRWDVPTVISHVTVTGLLAWVAGGYLHALATGRGWMLSPPEVSGLPRLRLPHVAIPLGSLVGMLLVFAGIQAEYLFGGADMVLRTTGLTVAEYARRGFFELVAVATLVLGLLLVSHAVIDRESARTVRGMRILATMLIGLVGVVMVSAIVRMRLYVENFGLTEDRIYATAFMLWVGAVLAWLAATVLRGRAERFAFGAVIAGFVTLIAVGAINPHGMIARTNIARAGDGRELDVEYLNRLHADAIPAIAAAWGALDESTRCALSKGIVSRWIEPEAADWRTWNLARARARNVADRLTAPTTCRAS